MPISWPALAGCTGAADSPGRQALFDTSGNGWCAAAADISFPHDPCQRPLADDDCYLALKARDARFDGHFFTGVTSTGIYCRPVCSVRTPKRENCRFFRHAAQAEAAGFRPCLHCRPELAPHSVAWSVQDASFILADQVARILDEPQSWCDATPSMAQLAARLGMSERHLRHIFQAQLGVSPLQYLQTRRLLSAKQLLADTNLPVTQVALISGFASVRRFNAAFAQHYRLSPTELRRQGERPAHEGCCTVRLGYRPPYDVAAMLDFLARRVINTTEFIATNAQQTCTTSTFRIESGGKAHAGWLHARFDEARCQLVVRVTVSLREVPPGVIRRVRALFNLDADPAAIQAVLRHSFPDGEGLRVPGALRLSIGGARRAGRRQRGPAGHHPAAPCDHHRTCAGGGRAAPATQRWHRCAGHRRFSQNAARRG